MPLPPWSLVIACLALGAALGVVVSDLVRRHRKKRWPHEWAIRARPIFSTHERLLWQHLSNSLPQHKVLVKVPLLRFCQARSKQQARYWYDLLNPLYVGLLICSSSGRVITAIDLDSGTSNTRSSLLKSAALQACGIRHVHCRPGVLPSAAEMMNWISSAGVSERFLDESVSNINKAVAQLSSTVRKRRAERGSWQDSSFSDSFLMPDSQLPDRDLDMPISRRTA